MQMHSSLRAIVLCLFAQAASAQCVAPAATQGTNQASTTVAMQATPAAARQGTDMKRNANGTTASQATAHPGPELIKTAAAGTRDDARPMVRETAARQADGDEHPRRGGTAMLLAALALMSGIALRRYGTPGQ